MSNPLPLSATAVVYVQEMKACNGGEKKTHLAAVSFDHGLFSEKAVECESKTPAS